MGRRAKSEMLDLSERIIRMYTQQHMTCASIAETLQDEGYDLSREAIRRSVKSSKQVAKKFLEATEEAKILVDAVRSNPNTDVLEATTTLLARRIFEFVRDVDDMDFDDPAKLTHALASLASSQTKVAKLRLDYQKGFDAAKKAILEKMKEELAQYPDLLQKLTAIVICIEAENV